MGSAIWSMRLNVWNSSVVIATSYASANSVTLSRGRPPSCAGLRDGSASLLRPKRYRALRRRDGGWTLHVTSKPPFKREPAGWRWHDRCSPLAPEVIRS